MIEVIGYAAGILTPCTLVPQIVKSFRIQKVEDISTYMLTLYILNAVMWVVYGVAIGAIPLAIAGSFALYVGLIQFFIKLKYQAS